MTSEEEQESTDVGRVPDVDEVIQDRYRLDSVVATGGMGVIMRATQLAMDRNVAIKLLHPHRASDEETVARFEREVHLAKHLSHPHTIQLFDFGKTQGGSLYIVMEFLEGQDLKELLNQQGPLPLGRAAEIGLQTLDGLAEAHDHDVIHRDLKPSNIYVQEDRRGDDFVKILDFGIAKSLEGGGTALTATGQVCGTPQYMAPEAVLRRSSDKPGDVYAMGLILFEMLIGRRLFDASSMPQTIMLQLNKPVPIPDRVSETKFARIIERSTAKHPDDRYQTAEEMFEDLAGIVDDLPPDLRLTADEIPTVEPPGSSDMLEQLPREVDNQGIELLDRHDTDDSPDDTPEPEADAANGESTADSDDFSDGDIDAPSPPPASELLENEYVTGDTVVTPEPQPPEPSDFDIDQMASRSVDQMSISSPATGSLSFVELDEEADSENHLEPGEAIPDDETGPGETTSESESDVSSMSKPESDASSERQPPPTTLTPLELDPRDPKQMSIVAAVVLTASIVVIGLFRADGDAGDSRTEAATTTAATSPAPEGSKDPSAHGKASSDESDQSDGGPTGDHLAAGAELPSESDADNNPDAGGAVEFAPGKRGVGTSPDASGTDKADAGRNTGGADGPKPVTVQINTYPSRAAVFHNGERLGLTPHEVELSPDVETTDFRVIRKGYYPKTFEVTPSEETEYRVSLERRPRRQARTSDDSERTGASGSESSGRSSEEGDDDEIENILDEHTLD